MIDKFKDLPVFSVSRDDLVGKLYSSSASVTHIYTDEMAMAKERINSVPLQSTPNYIA